MPSECGAKSCCTLRYKSENARGNCIRVATLSKVGNVDFVVGAGPQHFQETAIKLAPTDLAALEKVVNKWTALNNLPQLPVCQN